MLKPTQTINTNNLVPQGTHVARLYSIVDLGRQETEWNGEKKLSHKVRFTWELPNEQKTFDGETKPMVIGNQYTLSMGSKANLRPVIEGLLGVQLKDEEAANFDMQDFKKLLGTPCLVSVVHSKGDKVYANISSVVPLPKGMTCPPQFNQSQIFEIGTSTAEELESLPKFMQETIMRSEEMKQVQEGYDNSIPQNSAGGNPTNISKEDKKTIDDARNAHNKRNENWNAPNDGADFDPFVGF